MQALISLLSGIVFLKTAWNSISMYLSWKYISQFSILSPVNSSLSLEIVIPLLNERKEFPNLFREFVGIVANHPNVSLTFLTTQREELYRDNEPSTIDMVIEAIKTLNAPLLTRVRHAHYPNINKNLAEQLNWHFKQHSHEQMFNDYVAVYNADSVPGSYVIDIFLRTAARENGRIYQQSSLFLKNETNLSEERYFFGIANGIFQSIWTLTHEITRLYKNTHLPNGQLAHCVAHGLFIRRDALQESGFFPEDSPIEDIYLGFILRARGEIIRPLPILESSSTPASLRAILRQKFVWFWGPFGYFYFWKRISTASPSLWRKRKGWISLITVQGILSAANWLIVSPLFLALLTLSLIFKQPIGIFAFFLYAWIPPILFCVLTKKFTGRVLAILVFEPILLLLHSWPAYLTIFHHIYYSIHGWNRFLRPKTE